MREVGRQSLARGGRDGLRQRLTATIALDDDDQGGAGGGGVQEGNWPFLAGIYQEK